MNKMTLNSKGFDRMMKALKKKTGASYEDVLKGITGSILENAARKTYKSKSKIVSEAVKESLSTRFKSSSGGKIRKADDGSLIYRSSGMAPGKWVKLRSDYRLNAVSAKNPSNRELSPKFRASVNKSLSELRALQKRIIKKKKERIASSQKTFLHIMKLLAIPAKNSRGLGGAIKAKLTTGHKSSLFGKLYKDSDSVAILIKSKSRSALNMKSGGIFAFSKAFNGQVKAFEKAAEKDLETYSKNFATRNGFIAR
jgi:hypothetical protein